MEFIFSCRFGLTDLSPAYYLRQKTKGYEGRSLYPLRCHFIRINLVYKLRIDRV